MQQNTMTLLGTLASDILTSTDDQGADVARFRLVVHSRRLDRSSNTWTNGTPTFITVRCGRRLAHNVAQCLRRGDPVIVTGRLRVRESADKRLAQLEIDAVCVGPDLNRVTAVPVRQGDRAAA